ncbi:Pectinesterase inhibitor domain [Dillenia turbinata]|uniref:Pectinesterase n=1 Tax=Dillenia turbinata TaxID=194707 RepID=A0AAN8VI50_9MAGN
MAAKKPILAGVSVILVVGAVIGVIAGVRRISHSDGSSSSSNNLDFSTSQKAVSSLCSQTDYKDTCLSSLSSVANNKSATIQDIVQTAFKAVMEQVNSLIAKSGSLGNATNNSTQKMAMEDCQDMLQLAIADLQASISMVGESDLHTVNDRVAELMNWLSAVVSYQQSCLDGVTQPDMKNEISNNMLNATQLTSNALAITSAISQIVTSFNISSNLISNSRRLLEASEVDKDGYPAWFSHMDRKLLAKQDKGNIKPNAVVAKDGSGQYRTIAAALAAYPKNNKGRYVIYIKAGIYDEYLTVTKDQVNVFMYGDGPRKTLITGRKNNRDGVSTYQSASFCKLLYRRKARATSSVQYGNCMRALLVTLWSQHLPSRVPPERTTTSQAHKHATDPVCR